MKIKSIAFLLTLTLACGYAQAMQPMNSLSQFEMKNLEAEFFSAANAGREHINQILTTPGALRVHMRNCVESLIYGNGRVGNWSIGKFEDNYIIAARVLFSESSNRNLFQSAVVIKPGNSAQSKFEKGQNFWWMDWSSEKFANGTLYFQCDSEFKNFKLLIPVQITQQLAYPDPELIYASDLRLFNDGDQLFSFNPKSRLLIAKVVYVGDTATGAIIAFSSETIANHNRGNNFGILSINQECHMYLDWFYEDGVRYRRDSHEKKCEIKILPYLNKDFPLIGTGSCLGDKFDAKLNTGIMPLFSFGTPHVKVDGQLIGVGHIKIHTDDDDFAFKADSNIENFRKMLYRDFKAQYGDKYIRHDAYNSKNGERKGYNYLMYFYSLNVDNSGEITEMKISDSFLPLCLSDDFSEYKFSLIFPMGITTSSDGESLFVSAGYGDFYSVLMKFKANEIKALCKHDVQNLDLSNYQYKIMTTDNKGHVCIENSLLRCLPSSSSAVNQIHEPL